YENVPRDRLDLVARLESSRMSRLVLRGAQVASEKEVVANERRYRVDDDVEGTASERLYAKSFTRHPYRWPTIGWMKDIEGFTVDDCRQFYRTYYAPNNATVAVVGDIDITETLRIFRRYYGGRRSAKLPKSRTIREPEQR